MAKGNRRKRQRYWEQVGIIILLLTWGEHTLSLNLETDYPLRKTQDLNIFLLANSKPNLTELRQYALKLVNRDRQANGLAPLTEDALLNTNAHQHARDMIQREFFDHTNPDGQGPSDRHRKLGGKGGIAENISYSRNPNDTIINNAVLDRIQDRWMNSPAHRQNILTPRYTKFGFGIAIDTSTGETYAVQTFQ